MTAYASASYSLAAPMPELDSLAKLRAALDPHAGLPLVFHYAGRAIAAGYHVTEVKAASLSSLDCGANPEAWSETIIQLWDVERDGATHMSAGKFLGILAQVARRTDVDDDGLLIFEVGDSVQPLQVFTIATITPGADHVAITLAPRPATCKPRERGLVAAAAERQSCCSPAKTQSVSCCGTAAGAAPNNCCT